jgi:hypothetical protein
MTAPDRAAPDRAASIAPGGGGGPLGVLRRIVRLRPAPVAAPRCELCAAPVAAGHPHLVDLHTRALLCGCRACYLLFTDDGADLRYRSVPERYLALPGLDERSWDELQIPVGCAFLFRNSAQDRMVACYPGPAGATESELPLEAWDTIVAAHPEFARVRPDVEAVLVRRADRSCHLVPIDACYELVGQLRTRWQGFDGGAEARAALDAFFALVRERSRPAAAP